MSNPAYEKLKTKLKADPKTWLVTGCAGFIGSHLVEELLRLNQVVVGLDNFSTGHSQNLDHVKRIVGDVAWEKFRFIEGDVADLEVNSRALTGVDYVFHQAALGSVPRSIADPIETNRANVTGFVNLIASAKQAGVKRFVYASSSSVYGDHPDLPKREAQIGNCLSPYAVSKRVDELYAQVFGQCYGLESVGLRYFNVFGPRQDPNGPYAAVIPKWIDALIKGEACMIFGDGETSRDFCYVDNVVQANLLSATAILGDGDLNGPSNLVVNIAVGGQTTLNQLYKLLKAQVAEQLGVEIFPELQHQAFRDGDVRHSLADVSLAERLLDYKPTVDIALGAKRTVASFLTC